MDVVDGFALRVEDIAQGSVVWVSGDFDVATAPLLDECLRDFDGRRVTVDFSAVTFVDSSGLAVLIRRRSEAGPDALTLRGVQPAQMRVFEITKLDKVLNFDE